MRNMKVYAYEVQGYFSVNCYFYVDENTGHGFLIDPGAQGEELAALIRREGWEIEKILLTHGHFDHIGGIEALRWELDLPVFIHEAGKAYLEDGFLNLSTPCGETILVRDAELFRDGELFTLKGHAQPVLRAIHTPGHTPDSTVFFDAESHVAFVGDTIFKGTVGATHYPGGNARTLAQSIRERVFTLPEDTVLYSGHSEPTTVRAEKNGF